MYNIIADLVKDYDNLRNQGKVPSLGYKQAKCHFALCLNEDGTIDSIVNIMREVKNEKTGKSRFTPLIMDLPFNPKPRTISVVPFFCWDNPKYLLGIGSDGPDLARFNASKEYHVSLFKDMDNPIAQAIVHFFERYDPEALLAEPEVVNNLKELQSGYNLVFNVNGTFAFEDSEIRDLWDKEATKTDSAVDEAELLPCLVTGEMVNAPYTHPPIRGVAGSNASGAALISFNKESFLHYGHKQNHNAPMSDRAVFAYTTALNYRLQDPNSHWMMGDTTVVCWTDDDRPECITLMRGLGCSYSFFPEKEYEPIELHKLARSIVEGESVKFDDVTIDPTVNVHFLGLKGAAGRISVQFYSTESFQLFIKNNQEHYERLNIDGTAMMDTPYRLVQAGLNKQFKEEASPHLIENMVKAIVFGTPYPQEIFARIMKTIQSTKTITKTQAAMIKAYLLKNLAARIDPTEVTKMGQEPIPTNKAYTLGRLFFVLEDIQQRANPNLNSTIKDKYLIAASKFPAKVFQNLLSLSEAHKRKLKSEGARIYYDRLVQELCASMGEAFPVQLDVVERGCFFLGYYYQRSLRFAKKDEAKKEEDAADVQEDSAKESAS